MEMNEIRKVFESYIEEDILSGRKCGPVDGSSEIKLTDEHFEHLCSLCKDIPVMEHYGPITKPLATCFGDGFGMSTIEIITFKREGNSLYNGGINYRIGEDKRNEVCLTVCVVAAVVIDPFLKINGMQIVDFIELLYKWNNKKNIRIDYTLSKFQSYEDYGPITTRMCAYTRQRIGMTYDQFKVCCSHAKDVDKKLETAEDENCRTKVIMEEKQKANELDTRLNGMRSPWFY